MSTPRKKVYLILHNIRSTHNIGSIFRTADCAGVDKIFLTGYSPKPIDKFGKARKDIAKVALGAEKSIAWEYRVSPTTVMDMLKREGFEIIAVEQDKNSIDYKKVKPKRDSALILGNEVKGLSRAVLTKSDIIAEIPIKGKKESLNVSVTAGIALFRIFNL